MDQYWLSDWIIYWFIWRSSWDVSVSGSRSRHSCLTVRVEGWGCSRSSFPHFILLFLFHGFVLLFLFPFSFFFSSSLVSFHSPSPLCCILYLFPHLIFSYLGGRCFGDNDDTSWGGWAHPRCLASFLAALAALYLLRWLTDSLTHSLFWFSFRIWTKQTIGLEFSFRILTKP